MLADQPHTSAGADALEWLTSALTGNLGTLVAVIAVAGLGFSMLNGRIPSRRGAMVIIGCFILFSAPHIAAGIMMASTSTGAGETMASIKEPPAYIAAVPTPVPYDPYAGASVPVGPQESASGLLPK